MRTIHFGITALLLATGCIAPPRHATPRRTWVGCYELSGGFWDPGEHDTLTLTADAAPGSSFRVLDSTALATRPWPATAMLAVAARRAAVWGVLPNDSVAVFAAGSPQLLMEFGGMAGDSFSVLITVPVYPEVRLDKGLSRAIGTSSARGIPCRMAA
jgi:hypothetical protein